MAIAAKVVCAALCTSTLVAFLHGGLTKRIRNVERHE